MDIVSIGIDGFYSSGLKGPCEGVEHIKTLPHLSVVQALHGSYEIGLDGGSMRYTGERGIFVAPGKSLQRIIHHDGNRGYMEAQWIVMNVVINNFYAAEDLFQFPMILPHETDEQIAAWIHTVRFSDSLPERYAACYHVLDCLIAHAAGRFPPDSTAISIQKYISSHFGEAIRAEDIAGHLNCSVPQIYRYFKQYFSASPANYINEIRLQNAAKILEESNQPITEIAVRCGFGDVAYFSKLFKEKFKVSPSQYRKQYALAQ